jgi:hypothetical protein
MNPTVSLTSIFSVAVKNNWRVVESSVANSLSSAKTSECVRRLNNVDLPALV